MVPPIFVSASDELKNKTVCEDHELKLHCHESKYLNIYSATYGRRTQERDVCSSEAGRLPPFGTCFYVTVIRMLSERLGLWLPQERRHAMAGTWIRRKVKGRGQPPISGSCLLLPRIPKSCRSSLVAQWFKDSASSLLWLRLLLWCGFYPWLQELLLATDVEKKKSICCC